MDEQEKKELQLHVLLLRRLLKHFQEDVEDLFPIILHINPCNHEKR
jgi:hypothetical protein